MYMIPEDEYDVSIKHAMLHADLSQIYDIAKEKQNLQYNHDDFEKKLRKFRFKLSSNTIMLHLGCTFQVHCMQLCTIDTKT